MNWELTGADNRSYAMRRRHGVSQAETVEFPLRGAVAQLGERRVRNAKVGSSILLGSTSLLFGRFAPVAQLDRAIAS